MKDLGREKKILWMELRRGILQGKIYISQSSYIEKILQTFGMYESK